MRSWDLLGEAKKQSHKNLYSKWIISYELMLDRLNYTEVGYTMIECGVLPKY